MIKLGVNIDHSATLRQARYKDVSKDSGIIIEPNPIEIALLAEQGGADSITAHLREDRRHIIDSDIFELKERISTKLNLEMACTESMVDIALKVKPDYACLVPENRREVTTEGGLDVVSNANFIAKAVEKLSSSGVVCSLFIDPDLNQIKKAKDIGSPAIELHTGCFANSWGNNLKKETEKKRIKDSLEYAKNIGLIVNAGHGLNYLNIKEFLLLGNFNELNIGHSIIARSLIVGIEKAVAEMKDLLK